MWFLFAPKPRVALSASAGLVSPPPSPSFPSLPSPHASAVVSSSQWSWRKGKGILAFIWYAVSSLGLLCAALSRLTAEGFDKDKPYALEGWGAFVFLGRRQRKTSLGFAWEGRWKYWAAAMCGECSCPCSTYPCPHSYCSPREYFSLLSRRSQAQLNCRL